MARADLQKAIDLIEKSEHVTVFLPQNAKTDHLAAAEVFMSVLEYRNKPVSIVSKPSARPPLADIFKKILAGAEPPKEFIVSLDTTKSPAAQLRYEKNKDRIDVILSPKLSPITKEFVSFREGRPICDCAVMFGISDIDSFEGADRMSPEFFTDTPIINIDNSEKNRNYGEVNLTGSSATTLSEIIYEFSSVFGAQAFENKLLSSILLLGIMDGTENLRSDLAGADTFLAVSELIRMGGERNMLRRYIATPSRPLSLLQFFGRAAARTKTGDDGEIVWSFITREDFEKTGATVSDVLPAAEYLDSLLPPRRILIFLWQDTEKDKIRALFLSDPATIAAANAEEPGEIKKDGCLELEASFETFRSAEEYIGSLLAGIV